MGQRTQIVINVKNLDNGKEQTASYYNQWGIGKMQLLDVVRALTEYVNYPEEYKMPDKLYKAWKMDDKERETPFKGDANPQNVIKWINDTQDNNNGGLLLKLSMKYGRIDSGELYLFNDPEAENVNRVNRAVTFEEYLNFNPEYINEDFNNMFLSMLKFFDVEILTA